MNNELQTLPPHTVGQIDSLALDHVQPLLLCDVDEVVVHFLKGLESWLERNGLWLDPASFALNGNIRHKDSGEPLEDKLVGTAILSFFDEHTHELEAIDGAVEALHRLAHVGQIVMLTNIPDRFREARAANLAGHGLDFPIVTNSGPKGPAVAALARSQSGPVVFIDDHLGYLQSAREHHDEVDLVHFMQDHRFGRHLGHADFISLRTDNWREASEHIEELMVCRQVG